MMKFTVTFPKKPQHSLPAMPREFLCSFVFGMALFTLVVLIVAPWLTKFLFLFILGGGLYVSWKQFNKHMDAQWAPDQEAFFVPMLDAFKENKVAMTRGQLTYLWNYGSVPVSWTHIAKIDGRWNEQATVTIENTDYKNLWTQNPA